MKKTFLILLLSTGLACASGFEGVNITGRIGFPIGDNIIYLNVKTGRVSWKILPAEKDRAFWDDVVIEYRRVMDAEEKQETLDSVKAVEQWNTVVGEVLKDGSAKGDEAAKKFVKTILQLFPKIREHWGASEIGD